jgi:hypothetical protein
MKKKKKSKRPISLCTDNGKAYSRIRAPRLQSIYKGMAKGRMDQDAIAQLIDEGEFTVSFEAAILNSFHILPKDLNKKEKKIARYAYRIAETNYLSRLHKAVLIDDKAHNALKVIAEMKSLIKNEKQQPLPANAGLHVTVTDANSQSDKAKKAQKKYKQVESNSKEEKHTPLTFDEDQNATIN